MRKETIIKYEKEFIAWCKGESVLLGAPTSMHDRNLIWREVKDLDDWKPLDTVYVLNDSYSIYRKAMAEGKIIEYLDVRKEWRNLKENCRRIEGIPLNGLRIKPERHRFKKGDWVIHNGKYKRVTKTINGYIDSLDNEVAVIMKEESLEVW